MVSLAPLFTWTVEAVAMLSDGDSGWFYLTRPIKPETYTLPIGEGRTLTLTATGQLTDDPGEPTNVRLLWLNTPELQSPDPTARTEARRARADLRTWVNAATLPIEDRPLLLDDYGLEDRGGRTLGDLYWVDPDGTRQSASRWMLNQGWPPYLTPAEQRALRTLPGRPS